MKEYFSKMVFSGWHRTGPEKCPEQNTVEHSVDERECFKICDEDIDCMAFRLTPPCRTWSWTDARSCHDEGLSDSVTIFKKANKCKYHNM